MAFVSKGEMNTELAQKLSDIFKRSAERRYTAFDTRKEKKKKKEAAATGEHVDANTVPKGVLGKVHGYAQNGSDYLRAQNGRGVYREFGHKYLDEIRDLVRKTAEFPGGPPENFNPGARSPLGGKAGQKWPYAWEAHHMLPGSAFYYVTKKREVESPSFTYQQLRLILQSDYNINHGHNIINLPDESWAVPVHALIQHPGDHPQYTQLVMEEMRAISRDLQEVIDQGESHKALTEEVFRVLKQLEEDFWRYLVKLSRDLVEARTEGQEFIHPHVRYAPKEGTGTYEWGALY
ncbi:AHH domain-containing protein [Myxococcus stipitatus]|uniref:AHH domain-containing protein n=1 Tax=Myxococcus stipitatus TaxID=83455 RepID=UPI0031456905